MPARPITLHLGHGTHVSVRLDDVCEKCEGFGRVQHPDWTDWFRRLAEAETTIRETYESGVPTYQDVRDDLDAWEEENPSPPVDVPEEIGCGECDGTGHVLTSQGRAIIDLVRRHGEMPI